MGRVYTWAEVRDRHVPAPQDFAKAIGLMREEILDASIVTNAQFFGSVPRGDFNHRSDVDCICFCRPKNIADMVALTRSLTSKVREKWFIHVNMLIAEDTWVESRLHSFGPTFVTHLLSASEHPGAVIKGDVVGKIAESMRPRFDVDGYLRNKHQSLLEFWVRYDSSICPDRMRMLQKALEAPTHTARKVLMRRVEASGHFMKSHTDNKKSVGEYYMRIMPEPHKELFRQLVRIDQAYSEEVERQMVRLDSHGYHTVIQDLPKVFPLVVEFLWLNMQYVVSLD